jgi:hypothetical protein
MLMLCFMLSLTCIHIMKFVLACKIIFTAVPPYLLLLYSQFVCLFVWGPVSGCTAACRLIVHTPCAFDVPTFTARRLHVMTTLEILAAKGGTFGRETSGNLAESSEFHATLGIFYMPQIYDMGQTALLPLRRKSC